MKTCLILGGYGFVGSHCQLKSLDKGYLTIAHSHKEYDLLDYQQCEILLKNTKPDYIILAAAESGGILWNASNRDRIFYNNIILSLNVLKASLNSSATRVISLISSCAYPDISDDIDESMLWLGEPNPTIKFFGQYKRAVITYCEALNQQQNKIKFLCPIINNLYGPMNSNDVNKLKVVEGLVIKFLQAKADNLPYVTCFGTGTPTRQFTYVEDAATCILKLCELDNSPFIVNITTEEETSISQLSYLIKDLVGYKGDIIWDTTKPDGQIRKSMKCDLAKSLDLTCNTKLIDGLRKTIAYYNLEIGK